MWTLRSQSGSTVSRLYLLGLMAVSVLSDKCGEYVCENGNDYIEEGNDADKNEYPWQVRLNLHSKYHCGGSIIDEKNILTAAHCTDGYEAKDFTVWLGDHDQSIPDGETEHAVRYISQHSEYEACPKCNKDIAIIHLSEPLTFNEGVQAINMFDPYAAPVGSGLDAVVTGWGDLSLDASDILQEISVKTMDNQECREIAKMNNEDITDFMICAAAEMRVCKGDSGGPLALQRPQDGKWFLIGIASKGSGPPDGGCNNSDGWPTVFTRISAFAEWIEMKRWPVYDEALGY